MLNLSPLGRNLSDKQHESLDRLAERDPEARVTGWSDHLEGPIFRTGKGEMKVITSIPSVRSLPNA